MEKRVTIDFSVRTIFVVAFSLLLLWLVYDLRNILALFAISFVLAAAFEPAVNYFEKVKVPRWLSILGLYILVVGFLYVLISLILPPVTDQVQQLIANRQNLVGQVNHEISLAPVVVQDQLHSLINSIPNRISSYSSAKIFENALGIFSGLVGIVTVFVVVFYLLLDKKTLENFITGYWPLRTQAKALRIFKKVVEKVSLWARGQLILSGSIGLLAFIGLSILHVPYALTLALIAAVTEMLPVVGPYIGAIPAIFLAFTVSPALALWTTVLYVATQLFENHVLVPQVMKRAVGLSPLVIIFSILIGAKLLGIIGVVLAIPVAAGIGVVLEETIPQRAGK